MNIGVTVQGDKVVIGGLQQFAADVPRAIQRGMSRTVKGVHHAAISFLSGAGSKGEYVTTRTGKTRWKKRTAPIPSGGYPVPVRTGNLRRLLDFVEPGQSKSSGGHTFTAGPMEAIVYNSAEYARVIHDGTGSSAKFGPRRFLADALDRFNKGDRIAEILAEEITADIAKRGLA